MSYGSGNSGDYKKLKGQMIQVVDTDPIVYAGAWSTGGNLNTAREEGGGAGTQTAGLVFAGSTGSDSALNESYNGSSWTELADLNDARKNASGFGTQTAALLAGGNPNTGNTETWDNSSWTEVGNLNTGRENILNAGAGTTTAGLVWGGYDDPAGTGRAIVESWNGSAWSEVGDLNSERYDTSGNGTSTAAITVSGTDGASPISSVESWNGSAWTEIAELNTPRAGTSSTGTYEDIIVVGGHNGTAMVAITEYYNGSSWTEVADITTATRDQMPSKAGTSSLAFVAGGSQPTRVATTEEWSFPSTPAVQEGQLWIKTATGVSSVMKGFGAQGTGAWASGTSFNTGRTAHGSTGNTSNALIFGGAPPYTGITELWNGSSWTEVADLNQARAGGATAGADHTSALYASGANPPGAYKSDVEVWDGSSWSEVSEINQARYFASGIGTATAALFAGGNRPPTSSPGAQVTVESWDGSSWTEIADLNTARYGSGESGSQTSAIVFGGTPVVVSNELWNGSSWTEVGNLNTGRAGAGSSSTTSTSALAFGGEAPDYTAATESWDGSSWTEVADLSAAKANTGGSGTALNAIATGGDPVSANTEEWDVPFVTKTIGTD